jgi:hypothetical protein
MEIKINININDRIVNFVKKIFSGKRLIVSATVLTLATGILLYAAPVSLTTFAAGDVISAAKVNENFANLKAQVDILTANTNGAPVGTIMAFAGKTDKIPAGWLLCDGSSLPRVGLYKDLFDVIDVNWGNVNSSTFNLPDLRGVFLRGVDGTAGKDPDAATRTYPRPTGMQYEGNSGNEVGSFQLDALPNITGNFDAIERADMGQHGAPAGAFTEVNSHDSWDGGSGVGGGRTYYFNASRSSSVYGRSSLEARSKNAAVHYIIKY